MQDRLYMDWLEVPHLDLATEPKSINRRQTMSVKDWLIVAGSVLFWSAVLGWQVLAVIGAWRVLQIVSGG